MRKREASTARWIAIAGGVATLIGVATSGFSLWEHVFPSAPLEIAIVSTESLGRPTVRVALRNTTADPLVITRADLTFEQAEVRSQDVHASTELTTIPYTWMITSVEAEKKASSISLKRRLDAKEPVLVDFVLGFERPHTTFHAQATLHVTYNDGRTADSKPFEIRIVNAPGQVPQFAFPTTDGELVSALRDAESEYVIQQIIDELTRRGARFSSPDVQQHLASGDPGTLTAVAGFFRVVQDPSACQGLARLVTHDDAQVRRAAIDALVAQGTAAVPEVQRLADSDNIARRQIALTILGRLPRADSVNRLHQALDDRSVSASPSGEPVLTAAVAIRALAMLHADSEADEIVQRLADPDASVVEAAIDAVAEMRLGAALPALRRIASQQRGDLGSQARDAIAVLSDKQQ